MASLVEMLRKTEQGTYTPSSGDDKKKTSLAERLRSKEADNNKSGGGAKASLATGSGDASAGAAQKNISLADRIRESSAPNAFTAEDALRVNKEKNSGNGLGFTAKKFGLGVVQSVEGIFDYTLGGVAKIIGADSFAERQFARDWVDYSSVDEEYNPGRGWQFVGDVGGGLGTSLPTMVVGAAVTFATGGLAPVIAATLVASAGFLTAGLSAAGTATKEAYQETGTLGAKELGYGALSGAVEGGVEAVTGVFGAGATAAGKSIAKAMGAETTKKTAKAVAKSLTKRVAVTAVKEFSSEAIEEGFTEWIAPQLKRATYDPNAKDATEKEIAYAALVGGVSGLMTKGVGTGTVHAVNLGKGATVVNSERTNNVLAVSDVVLEATGTKTETAARVKELRDSLREGKLKIVEGEKITLAQQRALGELEAANMSLLFEDSMKAAAQNAINNAEAVAERLNQYGSIKMVNGKMTVVVDRSAITGEVKDITAEDIRSGYSERGGLRSALENNDLLRFVAASDVAGRLMMSAEQVEQEALRGNKIKSQVDLNSFIEDATPEKRRALGAELGIAENEWDTLELDRFNKAIAEYRESGKADAYRGRIEAIERAKAIPENDAKVFPEEVVIGDGEVERYRKDGADVAVYREGDGYMIYDYVSGDVSRFLTRDEMKKALREISEADMKEALHDIGVDVNDTAQKEPIEEPVDVGTAPLPNLDNVKGGSLVAKLKATEQNKNAYTGEASGGKNAENASAGDEAISRDARMSKSGEGTAQGDLKAKIEDLREKIDAEKIDTELREKVKDYEKLSAPNRSMIRKIVREGRVHGLSEADVLSYARVAARTGLNIEYDANMKDGEAGYFDPKGNRIVVNPKVEKKQELILIHELDHALRAFRGNDGKVHYLVYKDADKKLSDETWSAIQKEYADQDIEVSREELLADEASAYYTEAILGGKVTVDMLLGDTSSTASGSPSPAGEGLKKKILNFFTDAARAYSKDAKLAKEARAHYRRFKKLFDSFAERNKGRNAMTAVERTGDGNAERKSFSSIAQTFYGNPTMSTKEFLKGNYREQIGYKKYVEQCLNNYKQTRPDLDEATARREIEDAIGGIVEVAVAAKNAGYDIFDDAAKREVKDSKKRLLFSSLEPNSDYFTSSDISTICDKRINFAEIYDDIVRKEEALGVPRGKRFFDNVDNYFYIHKVLADKGLTQPCKECYVESMRKNLAPMATSFLELINEADADNKSNKLLWANGKLKENNAKLRERVRDVLINEYGTDPSELTVEDVSTEDGLATLKITMPLVYEAFNSFYGQAKPKMPRAATPFRFGELTALLTDNKGKISKSLVDRINKTGGFRLQSYSDFQTQNFVDVLQTIFEAGSLGLTGHAYTKVPAFLDATAGTNLKRNISIFMYRDGDQWRIDKNDSFPMSLEDIYKIVKADKSGNTGIIAVSQNAEMSAWIMANDEIAYGIPFHKSGLKMKVVRDTVVKEDGREIKGYAGTKDHTKQQTEVWKSDQRNEKGEVVYKKGTKVKEGISIYDGFWDFENKDGLSKRDLIRKNLEAYIDECEKRDYVPKFREYLVDNAKVLEDTLAYAKQLGFVKADATVDDISFKYKGYTVPYGYYKFLGDYTMFTADGKASAAEVLSLKDYDFKKAVKYFSDAEALRREEILRQFANGETRDAYRASTMTAGELENIVKIKRDEVVGEIVNKSARKSKDIAPKVAEESGTQKPLLGVFDKRGRNIEAVRGMSETRFRAEILKRFKYSNADNVRTRDLIDYHLGKGAIAMLDAKPIEITAPEAVGDRTLKEAVGDLKIAGVYENADIGAVSIAPSRMKGYATAKLSKGDAALLSSLGDILERGRVVAFSHPDGVLYEELQIVAPIKIGEKTVYAEATVRRSDAGGGAYVYSVSASADVKKTLYEIRKPAQSKRLIDKLDSEVVEKTASSDEYVDPEEYVAPEETSAEVETEKGVAASKELLLMLRKNRGRVRITAKDYADLAEKVGDRAARSIKNRWGYKKGSDVGSDGTTSIFRFVKKARSYGEMEGLAGMSTLEALAEIDRIYKANTKTAREFAVNEEIERLRELNKDLHNKNRAVLLSEVDVLVKKLGELKDATFFNASQYNTGELKSSVEALVGVEWRGRVNSASIRRLAASFNAWYTKNNEMLGYINEENHGLYDENLKAIAERLATIENEQPSNSDLLDLKELLQFAKTFVERFNKVYRDGKWRDAIPEAKKHVAAAQKAHSFNGGSVAIKHAVLNYEKALGDPRAVVVIADNYDPDGFFTDSFDAIEQGEIKARVSEMEARSEFDAFFEKNKGYANKLMQEEVEYAGHKMRRTQLIDLYMSLRSTTAMPGLAFSGFEFTNKQGREERVAGFITNDSWKHLLWSSSDADRAAAWEILKRSSSYQRGQIKKLLTEQDLEYIAILERGYLTTKDMKDATDEIRFGYKKTKSGYYLPTVRANVAKNVQNLYTQVDLVNNISANKHTKQGVTSEIYIGDSSAKFTGHVRAISNYSGLSVEIDNYNKIFNMDVGDNPNKPISVKTETINAWRSLGIVGKNGGKMTREHGGNAYMMGIIDSIVGAPQVKGALSSKIGEARGAYAQTVLGANWKSWISQMQSWIAAYAMYDPRNMIKGARLAFLPGTYEQMDAYCPLAKLRNYDNSAAKAQAVVDTVKGVGAFAMKPTSLVDRFVCALDFGAAQMEVERTTGAKVGTKENLEAAGKRLTEVILRTQQNTLATSKSAAARSGSELAKSVVMFKSDAIKTTGLALSTLGEYFTMKSELRSMKRAGASAEAISVQKKKVTDAGRRAFKANLANVLGAFFALGVGQLAQFVFYGKDDEEDEGERLLAASKDFVGNIIGGLPIITDIYGRFADGYEIKDNGYSVINDMLDGVDKVFDLAAKGAEGKLTLQDSNAALRDAVFAFSTLFGIPTKNIYKTGRGLIRMVSPNTLYKLEMQTELKNFASDFNEAVEAGDDDKAMMILGLLLEERLGTDGERTVGDAGPYMNEILRMEKAGYNVLPRTIGSTVTIAGEEIDMTPEEQTALRARYSEAVGHIEALVGSAEYAALSDEQRESAVRFVYDVYYDQGIYELYGYERNMKRRLFAKVLSPDKLALAAAMTAGLESDYEDEKGKAVSEDKWAAIRGTTARVNYSAVSGSKRKKVIAAINRLPLTTAEKLLIIAYKGYTVKDGDIRGVSAERAKQMLSRYARGQGLTKDEAKALEEYL